MKIHLKLSTIKRLLIIIFILYFLYTIRKQLFTSSQCSHLYNANSFKRCAESNKNCNITLLLNSYIVYRTCAIQYSPTDVDYVVFDAVNGLGNRILSLIAVTTYALVTGRVLLINWQPGDNHQAFFEDLFLPLSSSDKHTSRYQTSLSRIANAIRNRWMNDIEVKVQHSQIPNDWAFYFDREMLCDGKTDSQSWFARIGFYFLNLIGDHVRWIRTDQYFLPLLARNKENRQSFMTLFHNGQIFAEVARRFLHPVPKVTSIVEEFQRKYNLENKTLTIGVHMRSWSATMVNHIEPFQKCIEHVIQNISKSLTEKPNVVHLYIISNIQQRRQHLEDRLSKTYTNLKIINAPETPRAADPIEKMQYTLAELLILSSMQYLIITSKSTFGMTAQGLAHKGAWIVRQGASQEPKIITSDVCEWEATSEPEYQMMELIQMNNRCSTYGAPSPSIGERTIL